MARDIFNTEARRTAPVYEGHAGYHRMVSELRDSLHKDMPELKGRVEVFDWTNPDGQRAEYERIAKSLGTTFERLNAANVKNGGTGLLEDDALNRGGIAKQFQVGNKMVAIAYGSKSYAADLDHTTLNPASRQIVHEMLHGIDMIQVQPRVTSGLMPQESIAADRAREHFADIGSSDLLVRSGKRTNILTSLAESYQIRQGRSFDDPQRGADIYDNPDGLRMLQHLHRLDPNPEPRDDFKLKGWRESAHRAEQIRQIAPNLSSAAVDIDIGQNQGLQTVRDHFVKNALNEIAGDAQAFEKEGIDPQLFVEDVFTTYTAKTFPYHEMSGDVAVASAKIFAQQDKMMDWLRERPFLPMAERIINGYELQEGKTQEITGSTAQPHKTADQLMGQAAQQWVKTGDPLDRNIFLSLSKTASREILNTTTDDVIGTPISRTEFANNSTRESLAAQGDKLARLAKGESFDDVYQTGGVQTNEYLKKEYFRNKVAPETPFPQ